MHLCSEIPAFEPTQCPQSARCLKLPLPRISLGSCSHFLPLPLLPFLPSEQGAVCAGRCGTRDGAPRGWVLSGLLLSYSQWWLESGSHFSFSDNTSAGPALETNVQGASLLPRTVPGRGPGTGHTSHFCSLSQSHMCSGPTSVLSCQTRPSLPTFPTQWVAQSRL